MIYLKKINMEDYIKEYKAIKKIPKEENGFENKFYDNSLEEFKNNTIPLLIDHSNGIRVLEGRVPDTYFFLWDDDKIVGLFKIRHYLNEFLKSGPGHIGYGIIKGYRGKGYATKGLKLAIEECKTLIKEDVIYLSVYKTNPISLKVQKNNGAYIVAETEEEYLTRIKIR